MVVNVLQRAAVEISHLQLVNVLRISKKSYGFNDEVYYDDFPCSWKQDATRLGEKVILFGWFAWKHLRVKRQGSFPLHGRKRCRPNLWRSRNSSANSAIPRHCP